MARLRRLRHLDLVNCCFSGELLRRELAWTRQDLLLGYLLWTGPYSARGRGMLSTRLDPEALEECKVHLAALDALRHQPVAQHRGDIVGRLALLFSHLGRAVEQSHQPFLGPAGPAHPAIGRAMRLLEERLAYRWTLTELADQLHLAPGYLVRLFKAATGLPPMAYLARLRAEHAATLLLHSDQPVTCIGQAVGWPDQNYFARRFRAHYGLSATTYRARFATGAIHLAPNPARPDDLVLRGGVASEAGSLEAGSVEARSVEAGVRRPADVEDQGEPADRPGAEGGTPDGVGEVMPAQADDADGDHDDR